MRGHYHFWFVISISLWESLRRCDVGKNNDYKIIKEIKIAIHVKKKNWHLCKNPELFSDYVENSFNYYCCCCVSEVGGAPKMSIKKLMGHPELSLIWRKLATLRHHVPPAFCERIVLSYLGSQILSPIQCIHFYQQPIRRVIQLT